MSKIVALVWIGGAIVNPTGTKILLGKSVDLIHNLFGVIMHHISTVS